MAIGPNIRRAHRTVRWIAIGCALIVAGWMLYAFTRARPQDVPWTALDLSQPVGLFTARKIVGLREDPALCRALLDRAGARHEPVPAFGEADQCRVEDGLKLAGGARNILLQPTNPSMSCPVAAALAVWEWEVVQPAARRILGQRVEAIDHLGTYNCRRIAGDADGTWSQHATANAIDIAAFRLADGTRIGVLEDWPKGGPRAEFLRTVRDGACGVYATVLSPDFNAAHADHLHLDQADRGMMGWRACR